MNTYAVILNDTRYESNDPRAIAVEMACHFAPMAVGVEYNTAGDALKSAGMNGTQTAVVQSILDVVLIAARRQWNSLDHIHLSFHNRPAAMRREATACAVSRFDAEGNRRAGYGLRQVKKMHGGKLPARIFINQDGQYVPFTDDVLTVEVVKAAPVCGTCGGDGNCPDCMAWDAPLTEVLADLYADGMTDTDTYATVEAAILADYPVAEAAQPDPAPVQTDIVAPKVVPADLCPDCGGRNKSYLVDDGDDYSVWACECGGSWRWDSEPVLEAQDDAYIAQWERDNNDIAQIAVTSLDAEMQKQWTIDVWNSVSSQPVSDECDDCAIDNSRDGYMEAISELSFNLEAARDEIRRLNDVITGLQSDLHACERSRIATDEAFAGHIEAATAEAKQLRGEVAQARAEVEALTDKVKTLQTKAVVERLAHNTHYYSEYVRYSNSVSEIVRKMMTVRLTNKEDFEAFESLINELWRLR